MNISNLLHRLMPDLASAMTRFPVPALLSVALCLFINIDGIGNNDTEHVAGGAAAGFLAAGAAHLFAEGRKLARVTGLAIAIAAAAAAAVAGYFTDVFETQYLYLLLGLIPLVMVAPYLKEGASQAALWLFNFRLWLAVLLSAVVALAFALGLSAIAGALDFLFGVSTSGAYEHIWGTAMSLVAPLYGLSLMPRDLDEEVNIESQQGTMLERGVTVLVNYVLVPVIVIYAMILHAYAVKIVLEQALPNGNVAVMVSVFAVGGTAAWLIAWPWRDKGTKLLRLFMRYWFVLTIVPAMLLAIAIWRRIADYGVTPDRYGIAVIAAWVALMTLYLAWRRNFADMRAILGVMGVLLLLGSTGPFGANGLTITTQFARLENMLIANGLLKDGKAVTPEKRVSGDVASEGNSILHALQSAGGLERLRPWFEGLDKNPFATGNTDWALSSEIGTFLGFNVPYVNDAVVSFAANQPVVTSYTGSVKMIGPFNTVQNYNNEPQKPMTAVLDSEKLTIKLDDATYVIGARDLYDKMKAAVVATGTQPAVTITLAPDVTLVVDQFFGDANNQWPVSNARFWLVIRSGA